MKFYEIKNPTTKQIFDAVINNEYMPIGKISPKAKQLKVLLLDYWATSGILITFDGVTNTGGIPVFMADGTSLYEVASEINPDWYNMSEEDQDQEIELLGCYMRNFDDVFNL